jgi:hypothetical protein
MITFTPPSCDHTWAEVITSLLSTEKTLYVLEGLDGAELCMLTPIAVTEDGVILFSCVAPGVSGGTLIFSPDNSVYAYMTTPSSISIGNTIWTEEEGTNVDFTNAVNTLIATQIANKMDKKNPTGTG